MKYCNKCSSHKSIDQFSKDKQKKDGLMSVCRSCNCAKSRAYVQANPEKVKAYFSARTERIKQARPERAKLAPWKERNPEKYKDLMLNYYSKNKDQIREQQREYYLNNKEKFLGYLRARRAIGCAEYKRERTMCSARRRAKMLKAMPAWFDRAERELIYKEAARLTLETGIKYEVDHVVPIRSKLVCGLHWHGNLRILTKAENAAKGNRHWPDMP